MISCQGGCQLYSYYRLDSGVVGAWASLAGQFGDLLGQVASRNITRGFPPLLSLVPYFSVANFKYNALTYICLAWNARDVVSIPALGTISHINGPHHTTCT